MGAPMNNEVRVFLFCIDLKPQDSDVWYKVRAVSVNGVWRQ